jgi:hypothetical protein
MKASEVIERLTFLTAEHGDLEVFMDTDPNGLHTVDEIDVDADDTGIIFYEG